MKKALFAGSFDCFTNGHLDVLKQAEKVFDEVIVAIITENTNKKRRFTPESVKQGIESVSKCKVIISKDIPINIAKENDCDYLIRGIRNVNDFSLEELVDKVNKAINDKIITIYFRTDLNISSTMVYYIMNNGISIQQYIPYNERILIKC